MGCLATLKRKQSFSLPSRLFINFGILLVVSLILILTFIHYVFNQRIDQEIYSHIHNGGKTMMNTLNNDLSSLQLSLRLIETHPRLAAETGPDAFPRDAFEEFCRDQRIDFLCFEPAQDSGRTPMTLCSDQDPKFCHNFPAHSDLFKRSSGFGVENRGGKTTLEAYSVSGTGESLWRAGKTLSLDYLNSLRNLAGMEVFLLPKSTASPGLSTLPKKLKTFQEFSSLPKAARESLDQFLVYSFRWRVGPQPYQLIFYPLIGLEDEVIGALGVGRSLQFLKIANRNTYYISLLFILSITITFLAVGLIAGRSILRPLTNLKNTVTEFLSTDPNADLVPIKDDISFLDESFKQITERLSDSLHKLARAQHAEKKAQRDTLLRLAIAAEYKDEETASHILRLSRYSEIIARHLGLPEQEIEIVKDASPMHDIGKIGIPDAILQKRGPLTPEEFNIMKSHPKIGAAIFKRAHTPLYEACRTIAYTHHEKWDGTGYPQGLKGEEIPLYGRIVAVADVFDALTTERYYKPAFPLDTTLAIMKEYTGKHFDPKVMDAFMAGLGEIKKILGFKDIDLEVDSEALKKGLDEHR